MIASGLSALELRSIIESAFLPMRCTCTITPDASMTVQITDPASERAGLFVTGIALGRLNTCRDINDLVAELRSDLDHAGLQQLRARSVG